MSKWTNVPQEIARIAEVSSALIGHPIVMVTLDTGERVDGVVRRLSTGNNAASALKDGRWLYYGNFDLETLDGRLLNIDMVAVSLVVDVWTEKAASYERAGLINIAPKL
jgi:hypothetical protein